ncbi:MAG: rRNA maturation RNase YbeY [Opitutaceae bacterium]
MGRTLPKRTIGLANQHPGLSLNRAAVTRMVRVLDAEFRYAAADLPTLSDAAVRRAHRHVSESAEPDGPPPAVPAGELSLVFLTDPALAALHAQFLDDPSCTDVITFEGSELDGSAGEVCVSVDTAWAYARDHGRSFAEELTLYLVHGWLHLAGYDDLQPQKKRRMRAAEARAMALLQAAKAVPEFRLTGEPQVRSASPSSPRRKSTVTRAS